MANVIHIMEKKRGLSEKSAKPIYQTYKSTHKLHLTFDENADRMIDWMKSELGTNSMQEIVRRAMQAYRVFEPDYSEANSECPQMSSNNAARDVYLEIPRWIKMELDENKAKSGKNYNTTIQDALSVFCQLIADRNSLMHTKVDEHDNSEITPIDRLKLVATA